MLHDIVMRNTTKLLASVKTLGTGFSVMTSTGYLPHRGGRGGRNIYLLVLLLKFSFSSGATRINWDLISIIRLIL